MKPGLEASLAPKCLIHFQWCSFLSWYIWFKMEYFCKCMTQELLLLFFLLLIISNTWAEYYGEKWWWGGAVYSFSTPPSGQSYFLHFPQELIPRICLSKFPAQDAFPRESWLKHYRFCHNSESNTHTHFLSSNPLNIVKSHFCLVVKSCLTLCDRCYGRRTRFLCP